MGHYKAMCEKHTSVKICLTRCLFIGPPGVGKSSLKHLLLHNESTDVSSSTLVLEEPSIVTQELGSPWREVDDDMRKQLVKSKAQRIYLELVKNDLQQDCCDNCYNIEWSYSVHNEPQSTSYLAEISSCCHQRESGDWNRLTQALSELHQKIERQRNTQDFCDHESMQFIHFLDSGGQPVFHDILPLFIGTPCMYIYVFNSIYGLDVPLPMNYRPSNGQESFIQPGTETARDLMLRTFSSIHTMQQKVSVDFKDLLNQDGDAPWPQSCVLPVATFKDKLLEGNGELKNEEDIRCQWASEYKSQAMKPYESLLSSKDLLLINNQMYTPGSNVTEDEESTLEALKKSVSSSRSAFNFEIPLLWLLVDLITNKAGLKFIVYSCLQNFCLKERFVSSKREFSTLIAFMHTLGFFAYFKIPTSTKPRLICTDATFLYQQVSKLLVVQFLPSPQCDPTKELKAKGIIRSNYSEMFDELGIAKNDTMDRQWFLQLLVHVGIAAKVQNDFHFVPHTLPPKPISPSPLSEYSQYSVSPICFTVKLTQDGSFGPDYIYILPRGIFCQLCTYVIREARWVPVPERSCRTRVAYLMDNNTASIYLTETPTHIEISVHVHQGSTGVRRHVILDVHSICSKIKTLVLRGIEAAYKNLFNQSASDVSIAVGFTCPCRGASRDHHLRLMLLSDDNNFENTRCCHGIVTPLHAQEIVWLTKDIVVSEYFH